MKLRLTTLFTALALFGLYSMTAVGQPADDLYAKSDSWAATMTGSLGKYLALTDSDPLEKIVSLGPWYMTDTIPCKELTTVRFPEKGVELDGKGPNGAALWNKHEEFADGREHDLSVPDERAVYLYRVIHATEAVAVGAGIGSDDGVMVWLNGEKLLEQNVLRVAAPNSDRVTLSLQPGDNAFLMKIYNARGGSGFYFALDMRRYNTPWDKIAADFPREAAWFMHDVPGHEPLSWFNKGDGKDLGRAIITAALIDTGDTGAALRAQLDALVAENAPRSDPRWLDTYVKACICREGLAKLTLNPEALRAAIADLTAAYPDTYTAGPSYLERLAQYEALVPKVKEALAQGDASLVAQIEPYLALPREAMLANPLLDFGKLLLVKRSDGNMGLPQNWQGNCAIGPIGYDNEIATLDMHAPDAPLATVYHPEHSEFVGDVDLNWDADKMLFSMPGGEYRRWQIWEIAADGSGLRQATPGEEPDVDNYDPCYLPDGRIMFGSTRCFQGVPCVGGGNTVANMCVMNADGSATRQLCFDQDHNWCPAVLNSGRVLFSRWEYSDTPHYFSRILFSMNPDGTNQVAYYGSNSYWPNSIFYARPVPNDPSKVVAIVSGHHGVARMGELALIDTAKARFEADGVVQLIPGHDKKVEPKIMDTLVDAVWPKFLHPYPLSDKYFLVTCKPTADSRWGIYIADVFDNLTLIREEPGFALLEPVPFRATPRPPAVPDKVDLKKDTATVYIANVYQGPGLAGVPAGTIKKLRVYEYYYAYPKMGGHMNIGFEGPWDVHRILGTVPVEADGSASFTVPANIPVGVEPLDERGRAVQLMRSWFSAMPGENMSCVGCHEKQNESVPAKPTLASYMKPSDIEPWYGPARGFSFNRDVQPVLDKYCVKCHNGVEPGKPDFTVKEKNGWNNLPEAYIALHPYVRRPGPESDYHLLHPMEYNANTSELTQMLEKGHHGVQLNAEAWDRLYTWIDLNVPAHGTWGEQAAIPDNFNQRRLEMRTKYANRPEDPEVIPELHPFATDSPVPELELAAKPAPATGDNAVVLAADEWPLTPEQATAKQAAAGAAAKQTVDLGGGVTMDLALIPAGAFMMGDANGCADEALSPAAVAEPFWMGATEVTNAQFKAFNPKHFNGYLDQQNKDHTRPGYSVDDPNEPVIRVTWDEAMAFCAWLSQKTGMPYSLPTEAQWEWACRAGSAAPLSYGGLDDDFSVFANLGDASLKKMAVQGIDPQPMDNPDKNWAFLPKDERFNDGQMLLCAVGKYQPNAWGLYDMHGNVAEWTRSAYRPYPYTSADGRDDVSASGKKVVRGGSWMDRPKRARAGFRLAYESWQPVYNVGFRVVCGIPVQEKVASAK